MEENKLKFNLQFFAEEDETKEEGNDDGADNNEGNEDAEITFTPEQQKKVDEIIERRVAQEKKKADEYAKEKADEAARLAKMNKDQKAEYEREKLKKEVQQLREEKAMNEMRSEARTMFRNNNIDASDELLNLVVTTEAETTKTNVDALSTILDEMVQSKVKAALRGNAPKNITHSTMTREQILSIKDDVQRQQAIAANRNLFN